MWNRIFYIVILLFLNERGDCSDHPREVILPFLALENELFEKILPSYQRIDEEESEVFLDLNDVSSIFNRMSQIASTVEISRDDNFSQFLYLNNSIVEINSHYRRFLDSIHNTSNNNVNLTFYVEKFKKLNDLLQAKDDGLFQNVFFKIFKATKLTKCHAGVSVQALIFQVYEMTIRALVRVFIMLRYTVQLSEISNIAAMWDDRYPPSETKKLREVMKKIVGKGRSVRTICAKDDTLNINEPNALQYDLIETEAIQAISFRPQYSDIEHNRVVTGVKFVLQGKMLHIQIKEGTLLPFGRINSTQTWKPIEAVEWKVENNEGHFVINDSQLNEGFDYNILSQKSNPMISLQRVKVPRACVVTGVKLGYNDAKNNSINFKIQATAFNFVAGKLNTKERKIWRKSKFVGENDEEAKSIGFIPNSDEYSNSARITRRDKTVPFFDIQPVESNPEYALDAIKMFLKIVDGQEYLAMELSTIDFSAYIRP